MSIFLRYDELHGVASDLMTGVASATGLTMLVYALVASLHKRWRWPDALHPVLVTTAALSSVLIAFHIPYPLYLAATAPIHRALPLLFVLLAVPLWRNGHILVARWQALITAVMCSAVISVASAFVVALSVAQPRLIGALSVKSIPTAAALDLVGLVGGPAGLTVMLVVFTGIVGAGLGTTVFRIVGVTDERAQGLALGLTASALGVAQAFRISPIAGGFASVGMIINSFATVALATLAIAVAS